MNKPTSAAFSCKAFFLHDFAEFSGRPMKLLLPKALLDALVTGSDCTGGRRGVMRGPRRDLLLTAQFPRILGGILHP